MLESYRRPPQSQTNAANSSNIKCVKGREKDIGSCQPQLAVAVKLKQLSHTAPGLRLRLTSAAGQQLPAPLAAGASPCASLPPWGCRLFFCCRGCSCSRLVLLAFLMLLLPLHLMPEFNRLRQACLALHRKVGTITHGCGASLDTDCCMLGQPTVVGPGNECKVWRQYFLAPQASALCSQTCTCPAGACIAAPLCATCGKPVLVPRKRQGLQW